jgi:hypothetical protein
MGRFSGVFSSWSPMYCSTEMMPLSARPSRPTPVSAWGE